MPILKLISRAPGMNPDSWLRFGHIKGLYLICQNDVKTVVQEFGSMM